MEIREVEESTTHAIKFFEFVDTEGRTITSFFQAIKKPNISLGVYDTLEQARDAINLSIEFNFVPLIH